MAIGSVDTEVLVMMDNAGLLSPHDRGLTLRELVQRDVRKLMDGEDIFTDDLSPWHTTLIHHTPEQRPFAFAIAHSPAPRAFRAHLCYVRESLTLTRTHRPGAHQHSLEEGG